MPNSDTNTDDETDSIEISRRTAMVAQRELERLIERTGGRDVGTDDATTPLAEVKRRLSMAGPPDAMVTIGLVEDVIDAVAEKRGVDPTGTAPLVGATFNAESELREELTDGQGESDAGPGAAVPDGGATGWNGVKLTGDGAYPGSESADGGQR
jgi:hypothetical protein